MKTGKLPGVVENRSVFMFTGAQGMEPAQLACGACAATDGRFAVIATDQTGMFGNEQTMALRIGGLFDKVRTMLAAQGAEEAGEAFTVSLSLPQEAEETDVKKMSMLVAQEAKRRGIASYAVQVQGRYEMAGIAQGQHGAESGAEAARSRHGAAGSTGSTQGRYGAASGAGTAQITVTGVGIAQTTQAGTDAQEPEICATQGEEDRATQGRKESFAAKVEVAKAGNALEVSDSLQCFAETKTIQNATGNNSTLGIAEIKNKSNTEEVKNTPNTEATENTPTPEEAAAPQTPPVKSIVMAGHAALEATAVLISEKRETLLSRLTTGYLTQGLEKASHTDMREAAKIAVQAGALVKTAGEGGIFGALWELGEYFDCGMDIVLRDILLLQETIEVCEVLDVNPYLLTSRGCILAVTQDAEALLAKYREAGIAAAVIGNLKEGHDRVIHNEWEERFLEPFRGEELYQVL